MPSIKSTDKNTIRAIYNPPEKEKKRLQWVYDRYYQMKDTRQPFEKQWDKWEKQWEGFRPNRQADDWLSDIYIPITSSIVEAMMAEIINQELMPYAVERGAEDTSKAAVINAVLEYSWDVAKSNVAVYDIIHDALVKGTGIGQEYYWKQEREIYLPNGKTRTITEFDDCYLEPVPLNDFFVDEKARGFSGPQGAEDAIRRYVMDFDAFKNFFKGDTWDPLGNASKVKPGGDTNYYQFYKPPERLNKGREVEVLWYWNKPDDCLDIVANDVMVRMGPNPHKHKQLPFARAVDIKRTHQFYGKGEAELLESLQEETNTLRRMTIDRNHLDLDKPILTSDTLTVEDDDTIARPHGVISVGDVNQVKPLEYSDISNSVFRSLELLNDDKIRVTGMDERQQSVSSAGTATEAAILKEATLRRINMKIWHIKNDFLVDVGTLRVANIMQFYSQPKLEKIVGEKGSQEYKDRVAVAKSRGTLVSTKDGDFEQSFKKIRLKDKKLEQNKNGLMNALPAKGFTFFEAKPEYFTPANGGFDIRHKASTSIPLSKPLHQQKTMEMYDRLIKNPSVDPWKLAEKVLKEMEYEPEDFKLQPQGEQDPTGQQLQQLVDLAGIENEEMMNGNKLPPTPYANPIHTEMHIEFMKSQAFKDNDTPDLVQTFSDHVTGEIVAQLSRQGGAAGQAEPLPGVPQPGGGAPAQKSNGQIPGRMMGGGQMPSGMRGAETGIQTGRKI